MLVGEGVVGDGVLIGVGESVGAGVGRQVLHSSSICLRVPPAVKPFS